MQIGVMEFVGNHFSTVLHAVGTNLNVSADLSMNDVRDLGLDGRQDPFPIQLPPDRLRSSPIRPGLTRFEQMSLSAASPALTTPLRQQQSRDDLLMRAGLVTFGLLLLVFVFLPIWPLVEEGLRGPRTVISSGWSISSAFWPAPR